MNKILVVQTWGIGDMVMTIPMLGALRHRCPAAHITVIAGSRAAADMIDGSPLCDEVLVMSVQNMSLYAIGRAFLMLRRRRFDAAFICTRISFLFAQFLRLISGVKIISGDGFGGRRWGYSHWSSVPVGMHRVDANLKILNAVLPGTETAAPFFYNNGSSIKRAQEIWSEHDLDGKVVLGLHPGSGARDGTDKRIPRRLCLSISAKFLETYVDARVLIITGPSETDVVSTFSGADARMLVVHNMPIRIVSALIAKTSVFLAGDTGLGHIAAIQGVPVVTMAGPTHVCETRPWGRNSLVIRSDASVACMPCYGTKRYGRCRDVRCMESFSVEQVMTALEDACSGAKN